MLHRRTASNAPIPHHACAIVIMLALAAVPGSAFTGDVLVQTQADLVQYSALLTNVTAIDGSVQVSASLISDAQLGDLLSSVERITGDLNVNGCTLLENVRLHSISAIGGTLFVFANDAVTSISFPSLLEVNGSLYVNNLPALTNCTFPALRQIKANVDVGLNAALSVLGPAFLPQIALLGEDFFVHGNSALTSIQGLGTSLVHVGRSLLVSTNPLLLDITLPPNLISVGGDLRISYNAALLRLEAPRSLSNIAGGLYLHNNAALGTLANFSNLAVIGGALYIVSLPHLTTLGLSNLVSVGTSVTVQNNDILTNLTLSRLKAIYGASLLDDGSIVVIMSNPSLLSGTLPLRGLQCIGSGGIVCDRPTTPACAAGVVAVSGVSTPCPPGLCASDAFCANGGTCVGGFCSCTEGFGAGVACDDVNECLSTPKAKTCPDATTTCVNTLGSFTCACTVGFRPGNNSACLDLNECSAGAHSCSVNASCTNTVGSFACLCQAGVTGPTCNLDLNECDANLHNCPAGNTVCVNSVGSFSCDCAPGYARNNGHGDTSCVDVDACQNNAACLDANAVCVDLPPPAPESADGRECQCLPGYAQADDSSRCLLAYFGNISITAITGVGIFPTQLAGVGIIFGNVIISGRASVNEQQLDVMFGRVEKIMGAVDISGVSTLSTLEGFRSLQHVQSNVGIQFCRNLTSVEGLRGLSFVGGYLDISFENFNLTTIDGLRNLQTVRGRISLTANPVLATLNFPSLASVGGGLNLDSNTALTTLVLPRLQAIGGYLVIRSQPGLKNLRGFGILRSLGTYLQIESNKNLQSLEGLQNIQFVNGPVSIFFNSALMTLDGLRGLRVISDFLIVVGNPLLTSMTGLGSLKVIAGKVLYLSKYLINVASNFNLTQGFPLPALQCVGTGVVQCDTDTPLCNAANPISALVEIPCAAAAFTCASHSLVCEHGGSCNVDEGLCDCQVGYFGATCHQDINECTNKLHNCQTASAECTNTQGTFYCSCNFGFTGDGVRCTDLNNACAAFPCAANIVHMSCVDLPPPALTRPDGRLCVCDGGFRLNNKGQCEDVDECLSELHTCHVHATCANLLGSYACTCAMGFTGDGMLCANVDACVLHKCNGNTQCVDLPPPAIDFESGRECTPCEPGHLGNGLRCFRAFNDSVQIQSPDDINFFATALSTVQAINGSVLIINSLITSAQFEAIFAPILWINGYLSFVGNLALESISFNQLEQLDGFLRVFNCSKLSHLDGFAALTRLDAPISVANNDALLTVAGFRNVRYLGSLCTFFQNPALYAISGLQNVRVIESFLQINANAHLVTAVFTSLEAVRGSSLYFNTSDQSKSVIYLSGSPLLESAGLLFPAMQCRGTPSAVFCQPAMSVCARLFSNASNTVCPTCQANNSCLHGASCDDEASAIMHCNCPPGYSGPRCESADCAFLRCYNGATCRLQQGVPSCRCTPEFAGLYCEIALRSGASGSSSLAAAAAAAVGAGVGGAILLLLLVVLALVWRRTRRAAFAFKATSSRASDEALLAACEQKFCDAFATQFTFEELNAAKRDFFILQVPRKFVKFERLIGQGQSGAVHLGQLRRPRSSVSAPTLFAPAYIAVKMTRHDGAAQATLDSEMALQLEARLLHQLRHPHIVCVEAVVLPAPTFICLEYMANGDLKTYLRACRPTLKVRKQEISAKDFVGVLTQVCDALVFLERHRVVHRDIAARNVLVGADLGLVKLSDLGATRVLDEREYYRQQSSAQVPLKWMAPECIQEAKYTTASDVWAFGVLAYEVTSFAMSPYGALGGAELLAELETGYRLPQPPTCPDALYVVGAR